MSIEGWITGVVLLIPVLLAAAAPGEDPPLDPRRKTIRRDAWEMMLRAEEREGVREPRGGRQSNHPDDQRDPQAKWSNRR